MACQEGFFSNRALLFDGTNYAFWSIRMSTYLMALGFDIWQSVVNGYVAPSSPPTDLAAKRAIENNAKAMNAIFCGLSDSIFSKVMHCKSAKEIWDKLKNIYGDGKVKEAKLEIQSRQFEDLKMKDKENIAAYLLRVDEIVTNFRGLGGKVKDATIVKKVLRSLPSKFNDKVFAIEEVKDLDTLTMDELHESLIAYEMRINSYNDDSDEEEAHFERKLKKGSSKYKGEFSFKCFNCGKGGHFAAKCPFSKTENSEEEEEHHIKKGGKHYEHKKGHDKGKFEKKKSFYTNKTIVESSSSEEGFSTSNREETLFYVTKV